MKAAIITVLLHNNRTLTETDPKIPRDVQMHMYSKHPQT